MKLKLSSQNECKNIILPLTFIVTFIDDFFASRQI